MIRTLSEGLRVRGRGEGWVLAQVVLEPVVAVAPLRGPRVPESLRAPTRPAGVAIGLAGAAMLVWGGLSLGRNLTPLPRPPEGGTLTRSGAYRLVRHPIYSGACLAALGWALFHGRWAGLLGAAAQLLFFNAKANREEVWLAKRFPDYPAYRREVAKLIPGLY